MANEISVSAALSFVKGSSSANLYPDPLTPTMSGGQYVKHRQTVGFAASEALNLGPDVAAGGWCLIVNRDATNYVKVFGATGETALIRMRAGEFCLFRLDAGATAPHVQADTAACDIDVLLLDA